MITWIIEKNIFDEECIGKMVQYLQDNNTPYHIVSIVPFTHEIDGGLPEIKTKWCVFYTSIGTQKIVLENNLTPGIWTNDNFTEINTITKLQPFALNQDVSFMKLCDVSGFLDKNDLSYIFIKPNTDTKEFAGQVVCTSNFDEWYSEMMSTGYLQTDDFIVMVGATHNILKEYRVVVVDGNVCGCSVYKQNGKYHVVASENPLVISFAEHCAALYSPADVFVMDIADTHKGFKVIEYNTFNHAGLYKCHIPTIMKSINDFLEK